MNRAPISFEVAAIFLGFVSGFPLLLTSSTLQAWCVADGLKLTTIGMLSLLAWPYMLKFLWAPMLDCQLLFRSEHSKITWMVVLSGLIACGLYGISYFGPKHFHAMIAAAVCVAWCASTLDAAIDGYRIEALPAEKYGLIAGGGMVMYRLAMMCTGGFLIVFAGHYDWHTAYNTVACCMVLLGVLCVFLPKYKMTGHANHKPTRTTLWKVFTTTIDLAHSKSQKAHLFGLILLFKSSDALIVTMGVAFLLRHCQLSLAHLGILYKISGVMATLCGAVVAGWCLQRYALRRIMMYTLGIQFLAMLGFLCLAYVAHPNLLWVDATVVFECFVSGMASTVVVTLMMRCCARDHATTRYAFLSAIPAGFRILVGPSVGYVAQHFGWPSFFGLAALFALLPWWLCHCEATSSVIVALQTHYAKRT